MTTKLQSLLADIGLMDLLPVFVSQSIDDTVLADFSDEDLKEIGIEKHGDRKKLLKAFRGGISILSEFPSVEIISEDLKTTPQDQFTYDVRNGEIIITGFHGKGHVVVPGKFDDLPLPVRVIGRETFKDNRMLLSVFLPEGVTIIDYDAFSGCSSLTRVTIPFSVKQIRCAFAGCSSLESDYLIPFCHLGAFRCSNITSIAISEGVTFIGDAAFMEFSSMSSITIPESVISIRQDAFYGCPSKTIVRRHNHNPVREAAPIGFFSKLLS